MSLSFSNTLKFLSLVEAITCYHLLVLTMRWQFMQSLPYSFISNLHLSSLPSSVIKDKKNNVDLYCVYVCVFAHPGLKILFSVT